MLHLLRILKNTRAAIDLASIMVGIIVIGIIGGVIAATIFAVIPWSQDNGTKNQLDAVATAENAAAGLSSGSYSDNIPSLLNTVKAGTLILSDESTCYAAFKTSPTGNTFYITNNHTAPQKISKGTWPATAPTGYPSNCDWPAAAPQTANLLADPSSETGQDWDSYYGPTVTLDSNVVHSGTYSRKMVSSTPNDGAIAWENKTVTPGTYAAGMWLKAPVGTTWVIDFRTDPYTAGQGFKVVDATGQWQHLTTTAADLTGTYTRIGIQVHATNAPGNYTAYLDDADIYKLSS